MDWHRWERSPGRFSLVGTTIASAEKLPRHLVAEEKHTPSGGEKVYLAATLVASSHPGCHRTSNLVDRLRRRLDDRLDCAQQLHGSLTANEPGRRGWALILNFAPSCPWTNRQPPDLRSPAERLNGKRDHAEWLENLLVSAALAGYRTPPRERDKQPISRTGEDQSPLLLFFNMPHPCHPNILILNEIGL